MNCLCRCVASSQCHANITPATLKVTLRMGGGLGVLSFPTTNHFLLLRHCSALMHGMQEHLLGRCQYTMVVDPWMDHARRKTCLKFTLRLQVRIRPIMNCNGLIAQMYPQSDRYTIELKLILQAACLNNQGRRQFSLRAFQWEGR